MFHIGQWKNKPKAFIERCFKLVDEKKKLTGPSAEDIFCQILYLLFSRETDLNARIYPPYGVEST